MRNILAIIVLIGMALTMTNSIPAAAWETDGFVQVKGDQFVLSSDPDKVFKVKGFNYFPQQHPWAIFSEWDPQAVDVELAIAKDMNSNTLRTFITGGGHPGQATVDAVVEFVQIAKKHGQKVMVTMFDGYHAYPVAGSSEEANNFAKIDAIVGALKDDPGVFCWDIKNEPDWINGSYWSWSIPGAEAEAQRRIDWLYRMRNRIKQIDQNHLVTVGLIFNYNNYLPQGQRTIESFVDFVCYHYYPRNYPGETFRQSIQSLKARTSKPINVQEIGHNAYGGPGATEQDQANLMRDWLNVIEQEGITGIVQWTLMDWWTQWPGPDDERYYGYVRYDGNYGWKPAAYVYRDNFVVDQFTFGASMGTISGVVKDTEGRTIAGAQVTLNPGNRTATANAQGIYSFINLVPGTYSLSTEAFGYQPKVVTGLELAAGAALVRDITMQDSVPDSIQIINPGFEQGMTGWQTWGLVDGSQSGVFFGGITAHTGSRFLGTAANWGNKNGGVFQQIAVPPGKTYIVEVWSRTHREGGDANSVNSRLGVDVNGNLDPNSSGIVWTQWKESQGAWSRLWLKINAERPRITLFLQHRQHGAVWHVNCFDTVAVYQEIDRVGEAISLPDGWPLSLENQIVSARFADCFYVQDAQRAAGLKIKSTLPVNPGNLVTLAGQMGSEHTERTLTPNQLSIMAGSVSPQPVGMRVHELGGEAPVGPGGLAGAVGLYNSGLLVKVTGKVTHRGSGFFYVDDGSGISDGSGHAGVRVEAQSAWLPQGAVNVSVTGTSSRTTLNGQIIRLVRARSASDIQTH